MQPTHDRHFVDQLYSSWYPGEIVQDLVLQIMQRRPYPNAKGFSNAFLQSLADVFDRPVIGYNTNLGGYTPWAKVSRAYYLKTIARMKRQGWISKTERQGKQFFKLTQKGKLQTFLYQLQNLKRPHRSAWQGSWWLALFDIPEKEGRNLRHRIRRILRCAGFACLQKSVYVYPYEVPVELLSYLRSSGLQQFVRFLHVDRADDPRDLKKRCGV